MRGQALAINSTRWLTSTVGDYQAVLLNSSAFQHAKTTFSPPYWDSMGKGRLNQDCNFFFVRTTIISFSPNLGLIISLTQPCFHLDLLVGAVGLDIHLADLVEDFTYFYVPGDRSYVFLIDSIGKSVF